jgi:cytoskeletal protein RodZ
VENLPHNAVAQNEELEPPDLPDGWRSAELVDWKDPYLAASRRARAVRVALVVIVVALVIGVLLWVAATHYARGVEALEAHSYSTAVSEFSVARVLVFPYRDARSLEEQARRALQAEDARYEQAEARRAAVVARLEEAGARLEADDADGVRTTLQAISGHELRAALKRSDAARESADALALDLAAAARRALGNAAWGRAGSFAAALFVLEPSSELTVALKARARTGAELRTKLGEAKDAAQRGKWRAALRLALAVVAIQKDFPGAAAVVADARDALAPKPKPKPKPKPVATQPTPAATAAPAPQAGGGSATTTPPQPPPP